MPRRSESGHPCAGRRFLRDDPEFAQQLRENPLSQLDGPAPSPDLELRALAKARRRLGGFRSLLFLAIMFSCMAFGRIVSDTSFDVSPRAFIAVASIAAAFWIAFFVTLFRMRGRHSYRADLWRASRLPRAEPLTRRITACPSATMPT